MAEVTIYGEANFQGASASVASGEFGESLLVLHMNDAVSSIKVPTGMVAVVYEHADSGGGFGRFVDFLEDQPDLSVFGLNDQISWIRAFDAHSAQFGQWVRNAIVSTHIMAVVNSRFVEGHWSGSNDPIPYNPTPVVAHYEKSPTLLHACTWAGTPWSNPSMDTSDPSWASNLLGGKTFDGTVDHPFEWVSALNPPRVAHTPPPFNLPYVDGVQQDDQVAVSGVVVAPHASGNDIPFTHPFGRDFEFGIVCDPEYESLLAQANRLPPPLEYPLTEGELAWNDAHRVGFPTPAGVLPLEIDGNLVPDDYSAVRGDRVVVYGRWIVDAGHDDFHTEIHPPLVMARAHCIDGAGAVSPPRGDAITWVQIWSRPYQAGQLYSTEDEKNIPMRPYLIDIFETAGDVNSYPPVFPKPFDGVHGLAVQVDPPVPRSAAMPGAVLAGKHLECSYHLTTNGSCAVQIRQSPTNPDSVLVGLSLNSLNYPQLPEPPSTYKDYSVSQLLEEAGESAPWIVSWLHGTIHNKEYGAIVPPNHESAETVVPFMPIDQLPASKVVTDPTQPFPIYGWLKLRWAGPVISPTHPPVLPPVHPVLPAHPV